MFENKWKLVSIPQQPLRKNMLIYSISPACTLASLSHGFFPRWGRLFIPGGIGDGIIDSNLTVEQIGDLIDKHNFIKGKPHRR